MSVPGIAVEEVDADVHRSVLLRCQHHRAIPVHLYMFDDSRR